MNQPPGMYDGQHWLPDGGAMPMAPAVTPLGYGMTAPMSTPEGGVSEGVAPPTPGGQYEVVQMPQAEPVAESPTDALRAAADAALRQDWINARRGGGGGGAGLTRQQSALYAQAANVPDIDQVQLDERAKYNLDEIAAQEEARRRVSAEAGAHQREARAGREQEALDRANATRDEAADVGKERGFYEGMSDGQKVASVIALMAGAYGSVRGTPGVNMGAQTLDMFAKAKADDQRRRYAAARDKAEQAATEYGKLRQMGLDDEAAYSETQARARHANAMAAYREAATSDDPAQRARAIELGDQIMDQTRGQSLSIRQSFEQAAGDRRAALLKAAEAAKPRGGGGQKSALDMVAKRAGIEKDLGSVDKDRGAANDPSLRVPDGRGGFTSATTAAEAGKIRTQYGMTSAAQAALDRIEKRAEGFRPGQALPFGDEAKQHEVDVQTVGKAVATLDDSVERDAEAKRTASMIGNRLTPGTSAAAALLRRQLGDVYTDRVNAGNESRPLSSSQMPMHSNVAPTPPKR